MIQEFRRAEELAVENTTAETLGLMGKTKANLYLL
jgi:hypothetical protein